jgi:sphinganine-1-phosphate aldolase
VVPQTIHAAIDKGAMYFNIEVRKARLNDKYEADVKHMESLIDSNTIALYASYPNYPHGIIDPIQDIAKLAVKHKVGFHVDACLGGLLVAFLKEHEGKFTADIEGITSMSLDHHKYGLAPKGISTVFFKTREMRHQMYYVYADWMGGLYATPSFVGSRPGFASAGAWYAFTRIGRKQYIQNAKDIAEATKAAAAGLRKIPGVEVFGEPEVCVVAFNTTEVSIYDVCAYLKERSGWHMSSLHLPQAAHICVTPANAENVLNNLVKDTQAAIEFLKKNPPKQSDMGALYGVSGQLPSAEMGDEMVRTLLKACFK